MVNEPATTVSRVFRSKPCWLHVFTLVRPFMGTHNIFTTFLDTFFSFILFEQWGMSQNLTICSEPSATFLWIFWLLSIFCQIAGFKSANIHLDGRGSPVNVDFLNNFFLIWTDKLLHYLWWQGDVRLQKNFQQNLKFLNFDKCSVFTLCFFVFFSSSFFWGVKITFFMRKESSSIRNGQNCLTLLKKSLVTFTSPQNK